MSAIDKEQRLKKKNVTFMLGRPAAFLIELPSISKSVWKVVLKAGGLPLESKKKSEKIPY